MNEGLLQDYPKQTELADDPIVVPYIATPRVPRNGHITNSIQDDPLPSHRHEKTAAKVERCVQRFLDRGRETWARMGLLCC